MMKSYNLVILDNGHGSDTPGKCSPVWSDGTPQLFEFEFNRDIVKRISQILKSQNIDFRILTPETKDISINQRIARANNIYKNNQKCFLVSVHANAGKGNGWEAYTSVGNTKADNIATIFYSQFKTDFPNFKMRTDTSDNDPDKEQNFGILKYTKMPAILTENFFMDNIEECKLLLQNDFRQKIAISHAQAIIKTMQT